MTMRNDSLNSTGSCGRERERTEEERQGRQEEMKEQRKHTRNI
jgi:hypothetical protein